MELKNRGYRVIATARKAEDVLALQQMDLECFQLDINDSTSIQQAIEMVKQLTNSQLDILFNNCGYTQPGAVEDLSRKALREQFETNLFGPLELTAQIIPLMRAQGYGHIIFTGSLLGYFAMPFRSAYNASKFALEGFVDSLRQELHGSNIHVSLIEPGPIHTDIRKNARTTFLEQIDIQKSVHQQVYQNMEKEFFKISKTTPFYLPPEAVLKKLIRAIESKKPKARYYVGTPAYFFMILKRILPAKLLDKIARHVLKSELT